MVHTFYSHGARGRWRTGTGPRGGGCAMPSEADTCRQYVVPKLYDAGWTNDQIAEQRTFTDGRILVAGRVARRGKAKRTDHLLYYKPNYPLAIAAATASYHNPSERLQQCHGYASTL